VGGEKESLLKPRHVSERPEWEKMACRKEVENITSLVIRSRSGESNRGGVEKLIKEGKP